MHHISKTWRRILLHWSVLNFDPCEKVKNFDNCKAPSVATRVLRRFCRWVVTRFGCNTFPYTNHIVWSHRHYVIVVMRSCHFIYNDVMPVQRYFSRIFQMIVLKEKGYINIESSKNISFITLSKEVHRKQGYFQRG